MFHSISLQFRIPRYALIPPTIRHFKCGATPRNTSLPAGEMILEPTVGSSIITLVADIEKCGYQLIGTSYEERAHGEGCGKHYIVRFRFARALSGEKTTEAFRRVRYQVRRELQVICEEALWTACAYSNPLADEKRGMNVVLDTRKPFVQGDGQPVTVWQKDATGERIGDAPIPLKSEHHLRFSGTGIVSLLAT